MSFMDEIKTENTTTSNTYQINLGGQHSVAGIYGWICPVCGRGNSPFTSTCPCRMQKIDITCNPPYKTVWSTSTTGGTINEAR